MLNIYLGTTTRIMAGLALAISVAGLGGCGSEMPEAKGLAECVVPDGITPGSPAAKSYCEMQSVGASPESRDQLETLRNPEKLEILWQGLPAPRLGECSLYSGADMLCVTSQINFIERWPDAWKHDFIAMSDVASCFETGCAGAVEKDAIAACAWRTSLVAVESDLVGPHELSQRDRACTALSEAQRRQAKVQAMAIINHS